MHGFGLMIEELNSGAVVIALRGELDLAHAYTFDEELRRVEESRPPCVILDLRELTFLDSCGLARLLAARRRARRLRHRLLLVRGPAVIQRLFALAAVDEAFEMVNEVPGRAHDPSSTTSTSAGSKATRPSISAASGSGLS